MNADMKLMMLNLLRGPTKTFAGRQVAPNPGTVTGQKTLINNRKPGHLHPTLWLRIRDDDHLVRWSGDQGIPILVIRRVDRHTARITDLDGNPYSELMRIEDAIAALTEAQHE